MEDASYTYESHPRLTASTMLPSHAFWPDQAFQSCPTEVLASRASRVSTRPQRISRDRWDRVEQVIRHQYTDNNLTCEALVEFMRDNYGFVASPQQYARRFKVWSVRKNISHEVWIAIRPALKRRRVDVRDADVYLNHRIIPKETLMKGISRISLPTLRLESIGGMTTAVESASSPPELLVKKTNTYEVLVSPPRSSPWFDFLDHVVTLASQIITPGLAKPLDRHPRVLLAKSGVTGWRTASPSTNGCVDLSAAEQTGMIGLITQIAEEMESSIVERTPGDWKQAVHQMSTTSSPLRLCTLVTAYVAYACANQLPVQLNDYWQMLERCGLERLLELALDVDCPTSRIFADELIVHAVNESNMPLLKLLVNRMKDINSRLRFVAGTTQYHHSTALHASVRRDDIKVAKYLLKHGADPDQCYVCDDGREMSVLDMAIEGQRCMSLVDGLLDQGATFDKERILNVAIDSGVSLDLLQKLVDHGASQKASLFHKCEKCGHPLTYYKNPLITAIHQARCDVVEWLLPNRHASFHGGFLDAKCTKCQKRPDTMPLLTNLQYQYDQHERTTKLLLDAGFDPNDCLCNTGGVDYPLVKENARFPRYLCEIVETQLNTDFSPLHAAINYHDVDTVQKLVDHGADTLVCHGGPPLVCAAMRGDNLMVKYLLDKGADPCCYDEVLPVTPLMAAVAKDDVAMLALLLSYGADPYAETGLSHNQEALVPLYMFRHSAILHELWQPVNLVSGQRKHKWVNDTLQKPSVSSYLTAELLDAVKADMYGSHLLQICLQDLKLTERLHVLSVCLSTALKVDTEQSVIYFATLLSLGVKVTPLALSQVLEHGRWDQLIKIISRYSACEVVRLETHVHEISSVIQTNHYFHEKPIILDRHCLFDALYRLRRDLETGSGIALKLARSLGTIAANGDAYYDEVTWMFRDSSVINEIHPQVLVRNDTRDTERVYGTWLLYFMTVENMLHSQENCGKRLSALKTLIARGANVNIPNTTEDGRPYMSVLQAACGNGSCLDEIVCLIEAGASTEDLASQTHTALRFAAMHCTLEVGEYLVSHGAVINSQPSEKKHTATALQAAACGGNLKIVEYLLAKGAEVNAPAQEDRGATALQYAISAGGFRIMQVLVEAGADIGAPGSKVGGYSAIQVAAAFGRLDFLHYLLFKFKQKELLADICRCAAEYAFEEDHPVIGQHLLNYKT